MDENHIPTTDHVLRYISPRHIDNGVINGVGILGRPLEKGEASANWLECFQGNLLEQLNEVRIRKRIKYAATGKLVRLNVGVTYTYLKEKNYGIKFLKDPLPAIEDYVEDPSHALICGLPDNESSERTIIGDFLEHCILDSFPARG